MNTAAATVAIHGISGVLIIIAAILFLIAAITAWFVPRPIWAVCTAAGLLFWVLTGIIH
jgi:hypothetical protein